MTSTASGASIEAILHKDTGYRVHSPLIAFHRHGYRARRSPLNGDIIVTWDNGTNKIFLFECQECETAVSTLAHEKNADRHCMPGRLNGPVIVDTLMSGFRRVAASAGIACQVGNEPRPMELTLEPGNVMPNWKVVAPCLFQMLPVVQYE